MRDAAGMIAIPGFTRLRLRGPGACDWLATRAAGRVPAPGRVGLLYFCDERGRVVTEMTAIPESDDDVLLITAAVAQWHDRDVLRDGLPEGLALSDETAATEAILVTGPEARAMLGPLTDGDLARPWLSAQRAEVAGAPARLLRVSFAGELGWEIHVAPVDAPAVWDALAAAGARPFGMCALDALRIEKGYRAWKGDLSTDYTLLECGLERFVDWSKPAFAGRDALCAERDRGPARRFVSLRVDAGDCDAPYMALLRAGGEIVGEATSGAWGYRVGGSVALGMVRADLAVDGTELEIGIFGERRGATVSVGPLWDPENARMRA